MKTRLKKQALYGDSLLAGTAALLFLAAGLLGNSFKKPKLELTKQETAVNIDTDFLRFFNAGNKRLITDALWVQTLLESDIDHYQQKDLNNWMYLRFKTIGALDPQFYQNFHWGGRYLSIVKDDLLGAVELYKEGLENYPNDYALNYGLGFTYFFELSDPKNGLPYLEKIMDYPESPPYFKSLVGKMRISLTFDYNAALVFIQELIDESQEEELTKKLKKDFYSVQAERDLICLNNGMSGCSKEDADGRSYELRTGKYFSARSFIPYRLKKKGDGEKTRLVNYME